jgi:hypothetical protein
MKKSRALGAEGVLFPQEEQQLVDWLISMVERGYGLSPIALKMKVSEIIMSIETPFQDGILGGGKVVTATDGQTRPSVTSDKARVRHIRVNGMLTSDRVKPELLCTRWLPHRCHVGSLAITL